MFSLLVFFKVIKPSNDFTANEISGDLQNFCIVIEMVRRLGCLVIIFVLSLYPDASPPPPPPPLQFIASVVHHFYFSHDDFITAEGAPGPIPWEATELPRSRGWVTAFTDLLHIDMLSEAAGHFNTLRGKRADAGAGTTGSQSSGSATAEGDELLQVQPDTGTQVMRVVPPETQMLREQLR